MQAHRPEIQGQLDAFGKWYSRFVILTTLAAIPLMAALGVPMLGAGAEPGAVYRAMGWLTAAAPCAVVMVPLAYTSAQFALSRRLVMTLIMLRSTLFRSPKWRDTLCCIEAPCSATVSPVGCSCETM